MTEIEIENRLKILKQQLTIILLYPESFEEKLGKEGLKSYVDVVLDEIIFRKQQLKKLKNKKD